MRFLKVDVALAIREFVCIYSWKLHALCHVVLGYAKNRRLNMLLGMVWEMKYGRFTMLNIPKCEHFTLLVCPLRFLVISAMRRLGNVQSFKTCMFSFWAFCHECDPGWRVPLPLDVYMANCHPGWQGYPTWQTGQPTLAGYPTYHVNVVKIKWEIIWKGGLPHQGGYLTHPGSPTSM